LEQSENWKGKAEVLLMGIKLTFTKENFRGIITRMTDLRFAHGGVGLKVVQVLGTAEKALEKQINQASATGVCNHRIECEVRSEK
jgi:hypothetical protein